MLTDNLIIISIFIQTLLMLTGAVIYFRKNSKVKEKPPIVIIEKLPENNKGFGYVKGNSVVLNEHRIPYLFKTYNEASRRMRKVQGVDRIVFQHWDIEKQTVLIAEVKHGSK